jgi:hypothetical protein
MPGASAASCSWLRTERNPTGMSGASVGAGPAAESCRPQAGEGGREHARPSASLGRALARVAERAAERARAPDSVIDWSQVPSSPARPSGYRREAYEWIDVARCFSCSPWKSAAIPAVNLCLWNKQAAQAHPSRESPRLLTTPTILSVVRTLSAPVPETSSIRSTAAHLLPPMRHGVLASLPVLPI